MPRVQVDHENNAETWWDALREREPALAARLGDSDTLEITADELARLQALPGWADGPAHARTALIVEAADHG